jgi:hypothetical protein
MLQDLVAKVRDRAKRFDKTRRGAKTLLNELVLAEVQGADADALAKVRHRIGQAVAKRLDAETAQRTEVSIRSTPFTVTPEQARDLKRISDRIARGERTIPHEVVRQEWLDDMAAELQGLARTYGQTGRGARHFLEYLAMAENEGVNPKLLAKIRREVGQIVTKRQAA